MFLNPFYCDLHGSIQITAQQASMFAKDIAGDFNPIHDPDSKRFCVPGDLLFSLVLSKYGLSTRMRFVFSGMVGDGVSLLFPETEAEAFDIRDADGKRYLHIEREGSRSDDGALIRALALNYVAFSGHNFPDILVPLMARHKVMINPQRPLVIYESMAFHLERLSFTAPELELADTRLEVNGRRGDAGLYFRIKAGDEVVGTGSKKLVLSGLREYDQDSMQRFTEDYLARKSAHKPGSVSMSSPE